jgi:hypothetical protein
VVGRAGVGRALGRGGGDGGGFKDGGAVGYSGSRSVLRSMSKSRLSRWLRMRPCEGEDLSISGEAVGHLLAATTLRALLLVGVCPLLDFFFGGGSVAAFKVAGWSNAASGSLTARLGWSTARLGWSTARGG